MGLPIYRGLNESVTRNDYFYTYTTPPNIWANSRVFARTRNKGKFSVNSVIYNPVCLCQLYNMCRCTQWGQHGGLKVIVTPLISGLFQGELQAKFIISWFLFSHACELRAVCYSCRDRHVKHLEGIIWLIIKADLFFMGKQQCRDRDRWRALVYAVMNLRLP